MARLTLVEGGAADPDGLFDQARVTAFTRRIVDGAHDAELNVLELYHAANAARMAALAQLAHAAAAKGKRIELGEAGQLKVTDR